MKDELLFLNTKISVLHKRDKKGKNEHIKKGGKEEEYQKNVYQLSFKSKAFEIRNMNRQFY